MAVVGRAKYARAREKETLPSLILGAPLASRLLAISRARVCILPALQSPSPKLETTRIKSLFASRLVCLYSACSYCYFSNAPSIHVFCPFFPLSLGPL